MSDSPPCPGAQRSPDFVVELEMGISHADFYRLLPAAIERRPHQQDGCLIDIPVDDGHIQIEVGPQEERRLALIRLPVTVIRLMSFGLDQARFDRFRKRFELGFQKGGG